MSKTDALLSKEGVMQGDPLSMLMYASSTLPLIKSLYNPSTLVQNWYTDDSSCTAKLPHLLKWFQMLCELGPKYGYYPEPKKTILIVDPTFKDEANVIVQPFGISVVSGHRSWEDLLMTLIVQDNLFSLRSQNGFHALWNSAKLQKSIPRLLFQHCLNHYSLNGHICRRLQKGGLVIQRHNEIRNALGDLASIAFRNVIKEPIVKEANIRDGTPALIADISIRGPQAVALLDVRVVDTDAPSHIHWNTVAVLSSAEEEKKRKYNSAAEAHQASFTPFVVSTDGMLGRGEFLTKKVSPKHKH
ncbi:hypothetical protein EMCRGX_G031326 [Ephydatia muelleri]